MVQIILQMVQIFSQMVQKFSQMVPNNKRDFFGLFGLSIKFPGCEIVFAYLLKFKLCRLSFVSCFVLQLFILSLSFVYLDQLSLILQPCAILYISRPATLLSIILQLPPTFPIPFVSSFHIFFSIHISFPVIFSFSSFARLSIHVYLSFSASASGIDIEYKRYNIEDIEGQLIMSCSKIYVTI